MLTTRDKLPLSRSACYRRVSRRLEDAFGLLEGIQVPQVLEEMHDSAAYCEVSEGVFALEIRAV